MTKSLVNHMILDMQKRVWEQLWLKPVGKSVQFGFSLCLYNPQSL